MLCANSQAAARTASRPLTAEQQAADIEGFTDWTFGELRDFITCVTRERGGQGQP